MGIKKLKKEPYLLTYAGGSKSCVRWALSAMSAVALLCDKHGWSWTSTEFTVDSVTCLSTSCKGLIDRHGGTDYRELVTAVRAREGRDGKGKDGNQDS